MNLRRVIKEGVDDFSWIRNINPIEPIDLTNKKHVKSIKIGDYLEITGEVDNIELSNEPCEVVYIGGPIHNEYYNAWDETILVTFKKPLYSKYNEESTHCGPGGDDPKCNCDGHNNGTCWWVHVRYLDEVVRIHGKTLNESEFDWVKNSFDPLHVGTKYKTINGNILTITYVDYEKNIVKWDGFDIENDEYFIASDSIERFLTRVNDGNWTLVSGPQLNESKGDEFEWMRGDAFFTIDEILGKQMYYRKNNLSTLEHEYDCSIFDINRGEVKLGKVDYRMGWSVTKIENDDVTIKLWSGDEVDYTISEVEQYVNLGVWVLVGGDGSILNDYSSYNLRESEYYLNKIVKNILLTEDGKTEPDMEWDFTQIKQDLDQSKYWVKTKEDVKEYLKLLFEKIKNLPKTTKIKIIKYVFISFLGLISFKELNSITKEVSPEKIDLVLKEPVKKNTVKNQRIRKPSEKLIKHLKVEEGSASKKGEPVLTFYALGDGAYTVGYGHAVFGSPRRGSTGGDYPFVPNFNEITPKVTMLLEPKEFKLFRELDDDNPGDRQIKKQLIKKAKKNAEILLRDDVLKAAKGLNKILNTWEKRGIKPKITQGMYDAMVSMIYNMGIGNFRRSDFIQMVKRGDMESASNEIKKISSNLFSEFPGLKIRREKESELFSS